MGNHRVFYSVWTLDSITVQLRRDLQFVHAVRKMLQLRKDCVCIISGATISRTVTSMNWL
jgi:hypothetical protein